MVDAGVTSGRWDGGLMIFCDVLNQKMHCWLSDIHVPDDPNGVPRAVLDVLCGCGKIHSIEISRSED
jgi:hypothetical protein